MDKKKLIFMSEIKTNSKGVIKVNNIYKLSDDYQEIFLNNASQVHVKYEPLLLSSRTINKDPHNDIFLLEPHKYYKIVFEMYDKQGEQYYNENVMINLYKKIIGIGLIITPHDIDIDNKTIYLYNAGENVVMVKKNFVIGEWCL